MYDTLKRAPTDVPVPLLICCMNYLLMAARFIIRREFLGPICTFMVQCAIPRRGRLASDRSHVQGFLTSFAACRSISPAGESQHDSSDRPSISVAICYILRSVLPAANTDRVATPLHDLAPYIVYSNHESSSSSSSSSHQNSESTSRSRLVPARHHLSIVVTKRPFFCAGPNWKYTGDVPPFWNDQKIAALRRRLIS